MRNTAKTTLPQRFDFSEVGLINSPGFGAPRQISAGGFPHPQMANAKTG
jgi:hypothetical protein